jgi:hypothetical protein
MTEKRLSARLWEIRHELGLGTGDTVLGDIGVWMNENPEAGRSLINYLEETYKEEEE